LKGIEAIDTSQRCALIETDGGRPQKAKMRTISLTGVAHSAVLDVDGDVLGADGRPADLIHLQVVVLADRTEHVRALSVLDGCHGCFAFAFVLREKVGSKLDAF